MNQLEDILANLFLAYADIMKRYFGGSFFVTIFLPAVILFYAFIYNGIRKDNKRELKRRLTLPKLEQSAKEKCKNFFEKAFHEYAGSYQAINYMFLKEQGSNYTWVNREEDMGEPGLREAKMSYNPAFMLEKFKMEIL